MSTEHVGRESARPETEQVHLRVLGAEVALDPGTPAVRSDLLRQWSRCVVAPDQVGEKAPLTVKDASDGDYAILTTRLTRMGIESLIGEYLMFHAAGLATADGEVVVLVAASGTGKTTAARALAERGWGYVSDETIAVSEQGWVVPYPKPLSVTGANGQHGHKVQHGPDELGLGTPPGHLTITRMILLDRTREHAVSPALVRLSTVDALLRLIPQTSALARLASPLQTLCRCLDRCGGAFRLTYSEVAGAIPLIEALARDVECSDSDPGWRAVELDAGMAWALRDGKVRRRPVDDGVRVGDEAVVLAGAAPARLSGIGLTVWEAVGTGATLEELTDVAVAAHGEHPDAKALVAHAVAEMIEADVLAWSRPQTVTEVLSRDAG